LKYRLDANEQIPFHWTDSSGKKLIKVSFAEGSLGWSNEFAIDQLQQIEVKMIDTQDGGIYRLGVKTKLEEVSR